MTVPSITLSFDNKVYLIALDMALVCDIEEELGSVPDLMHRFLYREWKVSDLVAMIHMMLHRAGVNIDYHALGNCMIQSGLEPYMCSALSFLQKILNRK